MTPYGYSCTEQPERDDELQALAKGAVAAIRAVHGVRYVSGPICNTIYQATGSSVDYVNDVVQADYTFTEELRDTGNYGFLLPASQIVPTAEETFAGVRYLLQNMK
jgi:murein tripeptide amidase MpaA